MIITPCRQFMEVVTLLAAKLELTCLGISNRRKVLSPTTEAGLRVGSDH